LNDKGNRGGDRQENCPEKSRQEAPHDEGAQNATVCAHVGFEKAHEDGQAPDEKGQKGRKKNGQKSQDNDDCEKGRRKVAEESRQESDEARQEKRLNAQGLGREEEIAA
jgi:hypothetical protein